MRLHILVFLSLISCNSAGTNEQSKTVQPETVGNATGVFNKSSNETLHSFKNDTTVIHLKKIGVNLLDVRIDSTDKRELSIQKGMLITDRIEIPTQESIQGFAVNWIKATEDGFEISIEYGGSGRYYQKKFRFYYQDNDFVLKNILIDTFDKQNPEDENSYIKKTDTLKVPVKFKGFKVEDYL